MAYLDTDDRGRSVYRINWANFKGAHLAILMCVAGATLEDPWTERWAKEFAANLPEPKKPSIWPVISAMKNYWRRENKRIEAAREELEGRKRA